MRFVLHNFGVFVTIIKTISAMKILQIGYPKSGNYWLYKIIQESLDMAGVEQKNYIQQHPIYPIAQEWELSYPEQVDINMIDILDKGCFFRISSIFRKRIEDLEEYIDSNTHLWSHSNYCATSEQVFPMLDKIVYIIRDPRDVALSKADFAFTSYMQKHYPTWHESPSQYLEAEAETIARNWKDHVEEYLRHASRHDILILFYERLQQCFDEELTALLDYFGLSFSEDQRKQIAFNVSSEQLREESPQHVRKARHYKWIDNMPEEITEEMDSVTESLLQRLGYPLTKSEDKLPSLEQKVL